MSEAPLYLQVTCGLSPVDEKGPDALVPTPNPEPSTLHPPPSTLNPTPYTPGTKP